MLNVMIVTDVDNFFCEIILCIFDSVYDPVIMLYRLLTNIANIN